MTEDETKAWQLVTRLAVVSIGALALTLLIAIGALVAVVMMHTQGGL